MARTYGQQKAALTRAEHSKDPAKIKAECERAVKEWEETGWPDNWSRWNRALGDAIPGLSIDDLDTYEPDETPFRDLSGHDPVSHQSSMDAGRPGL